MELATMIRLRNGCRDQLPECLASLSEHPCYQDTVVICQDGVLRASRFILTLCLPFLRRPLRDRVDEDEVVIVDIEGRICVDLHEPDEPVLVAIQGADHASPTPSSSGRECKYRLGVHGRDSILFH